MAKPKKPCDRCHIEPRYGSNKLCKECKKIVLAEMKEARYLETRGFGHVGDQRTKDQKELTYETKFGTGHG